MLGESAAVMHVAIASAVTVHVLLYKRNVGAAVSWIGMAWLSPFLGGLLYATMGVNRVKRRAQRLRRQRLPLVPGEEGVARSAADDPLSPLEFAVGRLTGLPCEPGNTIEMLRSGDQAYPRMLEAIDAAQKSVGLQSYIFRADKAGEAFHQALIQAQRRGVEVRVLIDGVGGGYFWSGTYNHLRGAGVPVARFLHSYFPLTENWFPPLAKVGQVTARVVTSGPDEDMEQIEFVALHAISCARKSIRIITPYFLPPEPLTMSLGLAALRGVTVDIVLPEHSNHTILDWARRVPLRPLIEAGCRVWLMPAPFDHSKLMVVDDAWALIGSANWDTRSFRLNFELNVELHDRDFAGKLAAVAPTTRRLALAELDGDSLPVRLRNSAARLLQPYL